MWFLILLYFFTHNVFAEESDKMSDLFKYLRQKYPYQAPAMENLYTPTESDQDINEIIKNFLIKSEKEEEGTEIGNKYNKKQIKSDLYEGRQIPTLHEDVQPNTKGGAGFIDWIKNIFDDPSSDSHKKLIHDNVNNLNKTDEQPVPSLRKVFDRMATALEKINENLASIKDSGYYVLKVPTKGSQQTRSRDKKVLRRGKRSTESENISKNSSKEILPLEAVRNTDVKNYTSKSNETINVNNQSDDATGNRRLINYGASTNSVKLKLLNYINESFIEIQNKINKLHEVKQGFSENIAYKIGYIVSSIDTLEVNMKNLKRDMEINKNMWDDKVILDLFDKLKTTNTVISNLIELLKTYVSKSTQYQMRRLLLPQS